MISAIARARDALNVAAVLLALGVGVASLHRDRIDPEAIDAAALQPCPGHREARGYRLPDPGDYPLAGRPWIRSRADLIAYFTRGEDPAVVRRYSEGPDEELIAYHAEVSARSGLAGRWDPPDGW